MTIHKFDTPDFTGVLGSYVSSPQLYTFLHFVVPILTPVYPTEDITKKFTKKTPIYFTGEPTGNYELKNEENMWDRNPDTYAELRPERNELFLLMYDYDEVIDGMIYHKMQGGYCEADPYGLFALFCLKGEDENIYLVDYTTYGCISEGVCIGKYKGWGIGYYPANTQCYNYVYFHEVIALKKIPQPFGAYKGILFYAADTNTEKIYLTTSDEKDEYSSFPLDPGDSLFLEIRFSHVLKSWTKCGIQRLYCAIL